MRTPTIDEVRKFMEDNESFFSAPLKNQSEFAKIFRSLNKEQQIRDYSQQLKSLLEQPCEAPKCLLIKMTADPLSIPFKQTILLNPKQNGIVFYDSKLYYADAATQNIQPITAAENQEQQDAQDELIKAFANMENDTSRTTASLNINTRLIEIVSKHNQFAYQSFRILTAWRKGYFEPALQHPEIREFLIHNKNHAAIQLWNQQNTLQSHKSKIKHFHLFFKKYGFVKTAPQLKQLYSRLNALFEKIFNETSDAKQLEQELQLITDELNETEKTINYLKSETQLSNISELREFAAHYEMIGHSETSLNLKEYAKELTAHCDNLITGQITPEQFQNNIKIIYNNTEELLKRSEKPSYKKIDVEMLAIKRQLRYLKTDNYSQAHITLREIFQKLLEQQDNFISGKIGELTLNKRAEPIIKQFSDFHQKLCILERAEFNSILDELELTEPNSTIIQIESARTLYEQLRLQKDNFLAGKIDLNTFNTHCLTLITDLKTEAEKNETEVTKIADKITKSLNSLQFFNNTNNPLETLSLSSISINSTKTIIEEMKKIASSSEENEKHEEQNATNPIKPK